MRFSLSADCRILLAVLITATSTLFSSTNSFGQATCSTPTNISGFGVDGDVRANSPAAILGDSWFYSSSNPGSGIGVIGTSAATATPPISSSQFGSIIQSAGTGPGRNRTYQQRMSVPALSVINGNTLIDAFAARDNISPDSTAFLSSNKNGDNPTLWTIGTSSVPNKNDIIDVAGHLRRNNSTNKLWMFAMMTKLSTSGDSYSDIEIYRSVPVLNTSTGNFTNTGPAATGGHTAFSFTSAAKISTPGDIILCMNYNTSGGVASVKIWCNINNLDGNGNGISWFNAQPGRPFNFTGDFMTGTGGNGYGYAEIVSLSGAPCLMFSVLNSASTPAGDWGNLTGSSATYDTNIQAGQLVNIAFNFTDIGLDFATITGPCYNVFGAILFKTRSSSSYTAELKDCSGPYIFANFSEVQANAGPDKVINCLNSQVTLSGSSATPGATVSWSTPNGNIVSGAGTANIVVNQPGTYILSAQSPSLSSCFTTDTAYVTLDITPPSANAGSDKVLTCSAATVALDGSSSTQGVNFNWNAINGGVIQSGANTSTPVVSASGCYVLTVTNPTNGCISRDTVCVTSNFSLPVMSGQTQTNVSCFAACNGSINFNVNSGQSPYTFLWSNGSTSQSQSGLCAGYYTVTVTGANGCTVSQTFNLSQPNGTLGVTTAVTQQVSCTGGNNGAISASATGGTIPYTYLWNTGASGSSISGIAAGTYTVTVTDGNGCTAQSSSTVTQPSQAISATISVTQNVLCHGGNSGSIDLSPSGGTVPYTYLWSNGTTTQDLTNIAAGTYTVTVTDANGCSTVKSATVTQPSASLSLTASMTQPVSCRGGNNGSANAVTNGGTTPYTYLWSNGATTASVTGLAAGSYTVTVTDANSCTAVAMVTITQPSAVLAATISSQQAVNCFGGNNGSINLSVSGGTGPYAFNWSNGATTEDVNGLSAGSYTVTVTDSRGCSAQASATITQPSASVTASASVTQNVSCFGGNNGSVALNVSGGTPPYSYLWNNGSTQQNLTGLSAGTYSVTVTDANNCTGTTSVTITQPASGLSSQLNITQNVSCYGGNNGSLTLTVSNGTAPYSFLWNTGATSQNLTGLTAGSYSVTITDANGCTNFRTATISQPSAALNASVSSTSSVSCFGGSNGSVDLTVTGGTGPFSYLWNNGNTSQDLNNISSGTYTVTVTDANGCTATTSATVGQPSAALSASTAASQNVSCYGGANGSISLTVNGGTSPYSYQWNNGSTSQNLNGLTAGTYSVTVTDANGCTATSSVTVTQPSAALSSQLTVSQNVSCFGGNNGSLSLVVTNGTSPYTYLWNTGSTSQNLTGLSSGTYTVTVTDANGCTNVRSATVQQPSAVLSPSISSATAVSCFGGNNGAVDLTVSGGTGPYTYSWSNGSSTQDLSNLSSGTYTVTVTDANGCTAQANAVISQPSAALTASVSSSSPVSCFGGNNGSVSLSVTGGTSPYSYSWSNGSSSQNQTGLAAGTYTVTVTDANGCSASVSQTITQPQAAISATHNVTQQVSCFGGNNGSVTLSVNGGTSPYSFLWSNGSSTQNLTGLSSGSYTVTVTDANGCTTTRTVTITQPSAALAANASQSQAVSCHAGSDGQITLSVAGGTAPYTYLWSNGATTQAANGLSAGTYTVTVTDANGCTAQSSATITQPAQVLSGTTTTTSNISCFSGSNGSIDLTVSGGTGPFTFMWNTGATSEDLTGLPAGTYTVTITDFNGCTAQANGTITQPAGSLGASLNVSQNVACYGGSGGALNLTVSGGTMPYTFQWSNGATTEDISGLAVGTYTVSITDANGCIASATGNISQPSAPLSASINSTQAVSCFGGNNGSIDLAVNGGTSPYSYSWSNGATSQDINNLSSGTYTVSITDANGCTFTQSATISQPAAALSATIQSSSDVSCFGGNDGSITLNVSGGTSPYSFSWSNGSTSQNQTGLSDGSYSVQVTDANGCNATTSVTISQPSAPLDLTIQSAVSIACFGESTGSVTMTTSGGTAPYSYLWNTGATTSGISGIPAGTYTVTVTDVNGCFESTQVNLSQPNASLSASVTSSQNILCFAGNNGSIDISVSGGTMPYSYLWSNGLTTQDISGLGAGTYTVTITDGNGCTTQQSATLSQPSAQLSAMTSVTAQVLCHGGNNGAIDLTVSGGTSPYQFSWSNGATGEDISNLSAGVYTVVVTDANGCTTGSSAQITEPSADLTSSVSASQNVNCFGGSDGAISLTVSGGTQPYSFLWNNGASTQNISNLTSGVYTVTVTDANGCTSSGSAVISQPSNALSAQITGTIAVSCFAGTDGVIDLTVTGGTSPYQYNWSNGATTQDLNSLSAGTYSVTVTDANGCTTTQQATISQPSAQLTANTTATAHVLCFAGSNGSIDLTVTGGTSPYLFNWSNGATSEDLNGLSAGTYTVTVTDINGCTAGSTVQITEPSAALTSMMNATQNVNCFGGNDGAISLGVAGGTQPYSFIWSTGDTTQNLSNIPSGIYSVTITDANGCTAANSAAISQPSNPLSAQVAGTINVSCFGGNNGNIDLNVTGGTAPYQFIWSNGETTEDISNLISGTYTVTVTDANGCTENLSVTISQPAAAINAVATVTQQVSCFAGEDGSIDLTITGGTPPYSFLWSNGAVTEDISNLMAGTYVVDIVDANGCDATASATISQPAAPLLANATVVSNVFCNGGSNGAIDVTVNGGTMPYTYLWNTGQTTEDISGLSTGIYTVTITDANGCTTITSAGIGQPSQQLGATMTIQDVLCFNGNNGMIDITPTGGTPPYVFLWSNGETTEDIGGLIAGLYTVTITDANGCDTTLTGDVIQPSAPLIPVLSITNNVSCYGGNDGGVSAVVTGGTPPYVYLWNTGATTTTISNMPAGQYTFTVTDANGCNAIISDFISQPAAPLTSALNVTQDVSCHGGNDGTIQAVTSGGTAPYTYVWSTGSTSSSITGLTAGTYTVTVTDSKGCTFSGSATVNQPLEPLSMSGTTTIANCLYGVGGTVTISVNGGTVPYTYAWSNGVTTQNQVNVMPGSYTVTVTDANGCTLEGTYVISNESDLELHTGPTIICAGDFTTLWVDSIAGATYQWYFNSVALNGATSNSFTTPAAGYYYVTATTICGTFASDSVEIQVKSVDNATISNNQIICPPEMVQLHASGGMTYSWTPTSFMVNPQSANPVVAPIVTTVYTVEVTNEWNCKTNLSVTVAVACDTLFVPNGFSPNDDGVNDGFVIDNIDKYPGNKLWVYNRWGNLVYKAKDYNNTWDGVSNVSGIYMGKKLPTGTYFFILDLNNNSKPYSGYLILRR
jgi:gliding motility-associated-like protein